MRSLSSILRDLIVLGCLVTVPLLAVFGDTLPAALVAFLPGQNGQNPTERDASDGGRTKSDTPKTASNSLPKSAQSGISPATAMAGNSGSSKTGPNLPTKSENVKIGKLGTRGNSIEPASFSAPQSVPSRDSFAPFESRLQQLGANFYRLETSGAEGEVFHFHCEFPAARGVRSPESFEAIDADPLRAVARVVQQAEVARGTRTQ